MSKEFQNMDPNSATSLDDDHTKFRARFERLATLSLGYDPSLLQASPNSSSTVSRSPLQPVKIRTDWSRPDLDEDLDSDLNSSGICQFSLNNFEESRISRADSHESEPHEVGYAGTLTSILDLEQASVPSSPLMSETAPEKCPEIEVQTGLSTLLHTASDNDSDMDMSSICDISIADRTEGEILMSSANAACGEITASEPESDHGCLSEHILSKDDKASEKASGESVSSNCSAMADFPLPECEPSPSLDARQHDDRSLFTLERFEDVAKLSESESENLPHFINMTPSRRNPLSKSVEGTPARALFPARAHSVEGTPLKSSGLISRGASVSSSLNIEGTPSKRNRAINQVVSEVPELVSRLNSKHDDWTRRFEALKRISKFTTFHISAASLSEALLPLIEPLALQLQDLRSQIVKQACIAIGDLAVYLGVQFQPFARRLVPRLLDLLRIAKKVMSSSSDSCLRRIICHSHVDGLSIILNEAICNKSPIVRCRCLEYSLLALQSWDISELISYKAVISSFFSKVCSDSTKDVRTAGKRLFNEFAIVWPEDSRDLFQTFDVKLQKGILTEYPALNKIVSFSDDDFIAGSDFLSLQTTPSRPSLAEVKAALRRGSLSSACGDNDILFVEKSSAAFSDDVNLSCSHQLSTSDVPKTPEKCSKKIERDNLSNHVMGSPTSSSLSFKFDQSHPSAIHDRDRLAPALSPIPVEFLEGFPVPAPLRSSVPSDSVPMMSDPSPLVKHSSRRFTSRIFGTPINGKLDNAANDDDSSSSSSSCPTVEQSFDEADETGHLSVSSSIAAESLDVLCREAAPVDSIDVEQPTKSRESVLLLQSKLQYLRTMATSVFDECTSPVRTIEIHHDLTAASLQPLYQTESIKSNCLEAKSDTQLNRSPAASHNGVEHPILTPPKSDLKCDSTLQVGNLSFGASKSPKDVLNAVLSSPSSEHVFRSPDRNPVPAPSKPSFVKPSDVDDSSTLRSVLFILLSLIMFAILFHGLPEFLRPQSDELISKSKLHYSESHDDSAISTSSQHFSKIDIPIRDSGSVIYESFDSEEAMDEEDEVASSSNPQLNNFVPNEPDQSQLVYSSSDPLVEGDLGGSVLRESSKELSAFIEDAPSDFDETISNSASKSGTHEPAKDFNQMSEIAAESPSNQNVSSFATSDSHPRQANVTYHLHDVSVSAYAFRDDPDSVRTGFETESASVKTGSEFGPDSVETGSESAPDSVETGSETESGDASGFSIPLTPQLAYLYSIFVTMICWLTYRFRTVPAPPRVADRDPDFDLTGVTMAPEWDINLDSVLPSGPSPLPSPGGTDYQKWNHIKKDGTTMTLFSPLRRTLRIRRPRRPTQF